MNKKVIFISWQNHRRSQTLSRRLDIKLTEILSGCHKFIRYPLLFVKTFRIIKKENPDCVIVMNPSLLLSLFTVVWGKILGKAVIIDAHNVGIHFEHFNMLLRRTGQRLNRFIMKNAALTIVTNLGLAEYVTANKGKPFIIPDPLPIFGKYRKLRLKGEKNVFYICTFSGDEPYMELLKAAEYIDEKIFIYVSGDYNSKALPEKSASNIIFTGYLSETEYVDYLHSADIIVDLTYRQDCLVCGAYEAVAAEKPMVLSDTSALKNYFRDAALYTTDSPEDISRRINEAVKDIPGLTEKVKKLKAGCEKEWMKKKKKFEEAVSYISDK
ncbi:MAG: hypothetical protein BWK80_41450 [Desulfobacteraceae bacterium IS3]|nr:MAG: hypothetical protein BWK80_41450 [Desulfobacteraceae bacterium IS3]